MQKPENEQHFRLLAKKYLEGRATTEEEAFLVRYYQYFDKEDLYSSSLTEDQRQTMETRMLDNIRGTIAGQEMVRPRRPIHRIYLRVAAAAILLVIIAGGLSLYRRDKSATSALSVQQVRGATPDIAPGGNKASLTLANGDHIALDSTHQGVIARQGSTSVAREGDDQLTYSGGTGTHPGEVTYNTVTTPRGGQYSLVLGDGTKVWLNSESSVTFPTAFTGAGREVTLTGEAYFEIAHDEGRPFRVRAGSVEIEDIGTRFDVMAYRDERAVKATLLEGAVRVSRGREARTLRPGEQAIIGIEANGGIRVTEEDADDAIAWKNGYFSFNNTEISEIMKDISRWYDVNVVYADSLHGYLNGHIRRNVSISHVLEMLELTGEIKFRIEGRNVIVGRSL